MGHRNGSPSLLQGRSGWVANDERSSIYLRKSYSFPSFSPRCHLMSFSSSFLSYRHPGQKKMKVPRMSCRKERLERQLTVTLLKQDYISSRCKTIPAFQLVTSETSFFSRCPPPDSLHREELFWRRSLCREEMFRRHLHGVLEMPNGSSGEFKQLLNCLFGKFQQKRAIVWCYFWESSQED